MKQKKNRMRSLMRSSILVWILLIGGALLISCSSPDLIENLNRSIILPEVSECSLPDQGKGIDLTSQIKLTFSVSMNRASVEAHIILAKGGFDPLDCLYRWQKDSKVLTLFPLYLDKWLERDQYYLLKLSAEAMSEEGIRFAEDFRHSFTTADTDIIPPEITGITPGDGTELVPGYRDMIVMFSEAMNRDTAQAAFRLLDMTGRNVQGTFRWEGHNMIFTPGKKLMAFGRYTIEVSGEARDISGNRLFLADEAKAGQCVAAAFKVYGKVELVRQFGKSKYSLQRINSMALYAACGNTYYYFADGYQNFIARYKYNAIPGLTGNLVFLNRWGEEGTGEGQFKIPGSIAIGPDGSVFVCDIENSRIQKFSADGEFITAWGSEGAGKLTTPGNISVGPDGVVYVTDTISRRVQIYTSAGVYITSINIAKFGKAVLAPDNTLVELCGSKFIRKYTLDGDCLFEKPIPFREQGVFVSLQSLTCGTDGFIYVSDTYNNLVYKFNSAGDFIPDWTLKGFEKEGAVNPCYLVTGPDGLLHVLDFTSTNSRVMKFSPEGEFIDSLEIGEETGRRLSNPLSAAIGPDGSLFVIDQMNSRIQNFSPDGEFITQWGSSGKGAGLFYNILGLAFGPDNLLYVADAGNYLIQKFTPDGTFIGSFGSVGINEGQFLDPCRLAFKKDTVLVLDSFGNNVQEFDFNGNFISYWGNANPLLPVHLYRAEGIAIDSGGTVYISDTQNYRILKIENFNTPGEIITILGTYGNGEGEFGRTAEIAIGDDDSLFVTDPDNRRVQQLTSNGEFITSWGNDGDKETQLSQPRGVVIGKDGLIYITELYLGYVKVFRIRNY